MPARRRPALLPPPRGNPRNLFRGQPPAVQRAHEDFIANMGGQAAATRAYNNWVARMTAAPRRPGGGFARTQPPPSWARRQPAGPPPRLARRRNVNNTHNIIDPITLERLNGRNSVFLIKQYRRNGSVVNGGGTYISANSLLGLYKARHGENYNSVNAMVRNLPNRETVLFKNPVTRSLVKLRNLVPVKLVNKGGVRPMNVNNNNN